MIKKIIILAIVVCALIFLVLSKKGSMESGTHKSSKVFYSLKDKIASIQISDKDSSVELQKSDGKWFTKADNFPVDTANMNKLLNFIFDVEDGEVVSRNSERASEYGIDSTKRKTLEFRDGSGNILGTAHFGKTSAVDFNSTYWKFSDKDDVYRTPGIIISRVSPNAHYFKDKQVFSFEGDEIQQLDVTWLDTTNKANSYSVKAKDGEEDQWLTVFPEKGGAKKSVINAMANRFKQIKIDKFKDESDSTSLSEPYTYDIQVTLKSGDTHTIKALKAEKETYMKHPQRDEIVMFSNWRFEIFEKNLDDFFEPDTANADTTATSSSSPPTTALQVPE